MSNCVSLDISWHIFVYLYQKLSSHCFWTEHNRHVDDFNLRNDFVYIDKDKQHNPFMFYIFSFLFTRNIVSCLMELDDTTLREHNKSRIHKVLQPHLDLLGTRCVLPKKPRWNLIDSFICRLQQTSMLQNFCIYCRCVTTSLQEHYTWD